MMIATSAVTPNRFGSPEQYGAQIFRFSGIGTSTAAQRYHIGIKNGSTSATKLATAGNGRNV